MKTARLLALLTLLAVSAVSAVTLYARFRKPGQTSPPPAALSAFAPPGALLALESPDFHALLASWSHSAEQGRWLKSDDYAGFSRSRLFARLKEAQDEFATTAGLPPDAPFLASVAGGQSLFAWYDIGKLEFLYVTRMPPGEAAKTPLLALRERFEQRRAGGTVFYIRSGGGSAADDGSSPAAGQRTVAFAVHGDFLLLATREDLIADALQRMATPVPATLGHEGWYAAAQAAAAEPPGDLRMTLNLAKIVPSPYFRSYWVQQNISEMKAYSAALSDLYRSPAEFRESRVLLPKEAEQNTAPAADLAAVLRFLPAGTVYRATAHPAVDEVMAQLRDKLLVRSPTASSDRNIAPAADLTVPSAGSASDLEQRIDQPVVTGASSQAAFGALRTLVGTSAPDAMLVWSRVEAPTPGAEAPGILPPVHAAVVLTRPAGWNVEQFQAALTAALTPRLSVYGSDPGLAWERAGDAGFGWSRLKGMQHLALAIQGNTCVVATDDASLLAALEAAQNTPPAGSGSSLARAGVEAGVDFSAERQPLSKLLRRLDDAGRSSANATQPTPGGVPPPFFSGNMVSLGDSFANLASETFSQTANGGNGSVRQVVVYRWQPLTGR